MKNSTITKEQVTAYINSKVNAWAPSTLTSEHARLRNNLELVNAGPEQLMAAGSLKYSAYSLKTLFIRVGELYSFCYPAGINPFKEYMKDNANKFRYVYTKEIVNDITFEEALGRIANIPNPVIQQLARFILLTGTRACEAIKYDGTGYVIGKGARKRQLFNQKAEYPIGHGVTYSQLYKAMAKVGLKPHTLRKLSATRMVEAGCQLPDLLAVYGWTNVQTASLYLQPKKANALQALMEGVLTNGKGASIS